jgi:hypothetical protein
MLMAHNTANSIAKKNGATLPLIVHPLLFFLFILFQDFFKNLAFEENLNLDNKKEHYIELYCLKASSLSLAIGCQKYSKTVC